MGGREQGEVTTDSVHKRQVRLKVTGERYPIYLYLLRLPGGQFLKTIIIIIIMNILGA